MPEIVEKSSPSRSAVASYSSFQASSSEAERRSSVVAIASDCTDGENPASSRENHCPMARRALEPTQTSCGSASVERSPRWTLAGCPVLTHDDFHDGNHSRGPRAHGPRAETEHPLRRARVLIADPLPLFRAGV